MKLRAEQKTLQIILFMAADTCAAGVGGSWCGANINVRAKQQHLTPNQLSWYREEDPPPERETGSVRVSDLIQLWKISKQISPQKEENQSKNWKCGMFFYNMWFGVNDARHVKHWWDYWGLCSWKQSCSSGNVSETTWASVFISSLSALTGNQTLNFQMQCNNNKKKQCDWHRKVCVLFIKSCSTVHNSSLK